MKFPCIGCGDKIKPEDFDQAINDGRVMKCVECAKLRAYIKAKNPYLCEECFKKDRGYTQEQFDRAVAERRLPRWDFALFGDGTHKPVCGNCDKEGTVYG